MWDTWFQWAIQKVSTNQTPETRSKSSLDSCKTHRKGLLEPPLKLAFRLQMIWFFQGEPAKNFSDDPKMTLCFPRTFWDVAFCLWSLMLKKGCSRFPQLVAGLKKSGFTLLWMLSQLKKKKTMEMGRNPKNSQIDTAYFSRDSQIPRCSWQFFSDLRMAHGTMQSWLLSIAQRRHCETLWDRSGAVMPQMAPRGLMVNPQGYQVIICMIIC